MPRLISDRVIWRACAALIAAGPAVSLAYADIIVTEGMQPWHLCATCHSLDGISAMARFPKLAGQRAAYIVKQVRDFRDGRRSNDGGQMQASTSDIDDDDLAKTAAYFASLPPPPPDGSLETNGEEWHRGAKLFQPTCCRSFRARPANCNQCSRRYWRTRRGSVRPNSDRCTSTKETLSVSLRTTMHRLRLSKHGRVIQSCAPRPTLPWGESPPRSR